MADQKLRKFIVSLRPKEKEESIEKKRKLMVSNIARVIFVDAQSMSFGTSMSKF